MLCAEAPEPTGSRVSRPLGESRRGRLAAGVSVSLPETPPSCEAAASELANDGAQPYHSQNIKTLVLFDFREILGPEYTTEQ